MQERLQKIIAKAGISSRRAAEELVTAGRVRVNGVVVTELGAKADARNDKIEVDGKRLISEDLVYVVMHKPKNVVSTMSDPEGRPTVAEYLKNIPGRAYPVGRLDFATSGVLLATNDGDFANGMLHPKTDVPKIYVVKVHGVMTDETLNLWRKGVTLEDGKTRPAGVKLIRYEPEKTWFEVTLKEGRNQQVRRMGDATGHRVMRLARVSFAGITAENLRPGEVRALTRDELMKLRDAYGVPKKVRSPTDVTGGPRRRNERVVKASEHFAKPARASSERGHSERRTSERGASERATSERGAVDAPERGTPERGTSDRGPQRSGSERIGAERGRSERGSARGADREAPQEKPRRPTAGSPAAVRAGQAARSGRSGRTGTRPRGAD